MIIKILEFIWIKLQIWALTVFKKPIKSTNRIVFAAPRAFLAVYSKNGENLLHLHIANEFKDHLLFRSSHILLFDNKGQDIKWSLFDSLLGKGSIIGLVELPYNVS